MRILICVQNYAPAFEYGGRVTNAVAQAETLAKLGHSVTIVTTTVLSSTEQAGFSTIKRNINGVNVVYLGTLLKVKNTSINPTVFWFAKKYVKQYDCLYIIGLYDGLGIILASYARKYNVPYYVETCGMLVPIVKSKSLKKMYYFLAGQKLIDSAQRIFVSSKKEECDAKSFGISATKIVRSPNGINLESYSSLPSRGEFKKKYKLAENSKVILWMGRIEQIKNIEILLVALSEISKENWDLIIAGPTHSNDYLLSLIRLTKELNIENKVHFIGPIYDKDKLEALADSHMLSLVSLSENWGNVVQEALAASVPVLVTNTCGVAEIVNDNVGIVVDPLVKSVRQGIETLLTDQELHRMCKINALGQIKKFSWSKRVDCLVRIVTNDVKNR